jgi:hypothetical protein
MPVTRQPRQAVGQVVRQPGVDRIGIARFQQAAPGDGVGRRPIGDLEQCGAPLAHIRARVVVAGLL